MKNLHNPFVNFYFLKNKARFWVRDNMHSRSLSITWQGKNQVYIYLAVISKPIQNNLQA